MTRPSSALIGFVLSSGILTSITIAGQEQLPVFRSAANAVSIDATVQDRSRRPIAGLTAADFEILDNGVRQEIAELSYARLPIDVTVALDVSYSVNGLMLERLRRGITQLMADFGAGDRLKLLLFNSRISRSVDFTTETAKVEAAIRGAVAGGGTALLDAVSVAVTQAADSDRRQLLMVFTDGIDSTSTTPPSVLTSVVLRSRAALTFVLPATAALGTSTFVPPVPTVQSTGTNSILNGYNTLAAANARQQAFNAAAVAPPRALDPVFRNLAGLTGGNVVATTAASDLTALFRQILSEFRSAYVLRYHVKDPAVAGYHVIDVKVKRDGAIVNARRGYWQ